MKKVFLAVLAAGLFFACGNNTNDKNKEAENKQETTETTNDQVAEDQNAPAEEVATETQTEAQPTTEKKSETAEIIEESAKAAVDITNAVGEQSKASAGRGTKK
jgi:hypothetical protein